ncbi:MAG: CDP-glycerol glycerophosphotransferase family protein [Candidatus Sungiibacteriota bacterium]
MRTIFIPIFSGMEGKNILRTDIYRVLAERSDIQLVFFLRHAALKTYYANEFAHPRSVFEVVPDVRRSAAERFFSFLKYYLLRSATVDLRRRLHREESGNWFYYGLSFFANRLLARPSIRRIVRFIDERLIRESVFEEFFEKYNPALIFLADLFDDLECAFARAARRRGVRSVGMINTWDRTTSRWMIRTLPDYFIVFNEIMKKELADYADMESIRIAVCGTVQHDHLVAHPPTPRQIFFQKMGIPLTHRLLVYCPLGAAFDGSRKTLDAHIIARLSSWITGRAFGTDEITLVVRFHPNDRVREEDLKSYPHVVYDIPGIKFAREFASSVVARTRGQNWDMSQEDLDRLRDTLAYAAVVICYYTSLSIDGAVLDKPVININFDVKNDIFVEVPHPYYTTTHYQKAAVTAGIRLVHNEKELQEWIVLYLNDPSRDREGRARLVETQCGSVDGKSGKRVGEFILSFLEKNR